jgi:4-amino-4-deoxy-L-arabinose transferase-like glycosyltransferase
MNYMNQPLSFLKVYGAPLFLVVMFLLLGFQGIGKFETVDEHFWKYERIPEYWQAWQNGNLKKTAVNDKPGITVAFFNGAGLLFVDPLQHRVRDEGVTQNGNLTLYNADQTEKLNTALRFPGLLVNALLLLVIFGVSLQVFRSQALALALTTFVALSPILIGITQIMNPDTYLWSFSFVAFLLWLWYLKEPSTSKAVLAGAALGLTILSKYTGLILFPAFFFFLFICGESTPKKLWQYVKGFAVATLVAMLTLVTLLPATLVKPKLLWASTAGFFAEQGVLWPLVAAGTFLLVWLILFPKGMTGVLQTLHTFLVRSARYLVIPFAVLFIGTFVLGLGNQSLVPLEAHYLSSKEDEALVFPLIPEGTPGPVAFVIKLAVQFYPLVFSLHPLAFATISFFLIVSVFGRSRLLQQDAIERTTLFITWFSLLFIAMNLAAGVLINARYGIILFPLWYLLAAFGVTELHLYLKEKWTFSYIHSALFLSILVLVLFVNTYQTKPFLFNYSSPFLKKDFVIHDAWGYGLYQAAEYLNTLPVGEQPIYVWSDRNGLCQFLLPHVQCVSGFKIDRQQTPLSYIIISKRGLERGYKPRYLIPETGKSAQVIDYIGIEKNALWRLDILGRPDNFIMVVPVQ